MQPTDTFLKTLTLSSNGSSLLQKVVSTTSFMTFFTRKSLSLFLPPLVRLEYPTLSYSGFTNPIVPSYSGHILAMDAISTRIHVWEPTSVPGNDPDNVKNLFMIPGATVDHQIFALPTIPFNAVNYFTRAGYRVHISVHRIGQLIVAQNTWTTYDARLDLEACSSWIREQHGYEKIYTIAHCLGSVALASGLLDGTIPPEWISGISCSQVFMHTIWNSSLSMVRPQFDLARVETIYTAPMGA